MSREQIRKSIKAGKLFHEDFPTDKFDGVLTILLFFLMSVGFLFAVIFDKLHNQQPASAMVVVGIGTGVCFEAQTATGLPQRRALLQWHGRVGFWYVTTH